MFRAWFRGGPLEKSWWRRRKGGGGDSVWENTEKKILREKNLLIKRATQKQIPITPGREDIFASKRKQTRFCIARQKQKGAFLWGDLGRDWSGSYNLKINRNMVYQRNRWIHSGYGFIGFFEAPWSRQILDHWSLFRSTQRTQPKSGEHS